MKTRPWENSSTLQNVCGKLAQLQNLHRQLIPKDILIEIVSKNISKYSKLICLLIDNIGLGPRSYPWQWYRFTTNSGHELCALNIALQAIP